MVCKTCGKEFYEDWRKSKEQRKKPLLYCSSSCSHSRAQTEEIREKKSRSMHSHLGTEYKTCSVCGKRLGWRNKSGVCSECKKSDKTQYDHLKKFRQDRKRKLIEYKGGRCERCGYDKCIAALDFHHIDPSEKEFSLGSGHTGTSRSWESVLAEVDKCMLLCANCHRELHYEQL